MTPSIETVKMMNNKEFGIPQKPKFNGIQFDYIRDMEKGTVSRIDFNFKDKKASCCFESIDNEHEAEHLAKCVFKITNARGIKYDLNRTYAALMRNDTKPLYLNSYLLNDVDFSYLLVLVLDKLNKTITNDKDFQSICQKLFNRNYSVIHDYIRNTCITTLYSLINPSHLPTEGDLNSYIPSKEEYKDLNKVIKMYTRLLGEVISILISITNPYGLITIDYFIAIDLSKPFVWLEIK